MAEPSQWAQKKAALRDVIAGVAKLHPRAVIWNTAPDPAATKLIKLEVIRANQEGDDRRVKTINEETGNYDVEVSSLISFTLNIRCEDVKGGDAFEIAELVRAGLGWESTDAKLEESGLAFIDVAGPTTPADVAIDERMHVAAVFDCLFRAEFHRADPVAQSTIEHVQFTGELDSGEPPPVTMTINVDR
jgi:hypothetical protein